MKLFKRIVCMIMSVCLMLSFAGCGKDEAQTSGDITKLKMVLVGERPGIYDEIWGKVNEMLREDIGAEVEIEYYQYGDLQQKYSLLFSSGEYVDLVFSADWIKYNKQASMNSFMEITDEMLKKNAPKTYETLTDTIKKEASVNGKLYMIPHTVPAYSHYIVLVRGDLREKYGMPEITSAELLEEYLENVAKKDKQMIPFTDTGKKIRDIFITNPRGEMYLDIPASTGMAYDVIKGKFTINIDTKAYIDTYKKAREFVDKGILPADIIANKTTDNMFENGKCATYINNLDTTAKLAVKLRESHPEWKVELCDVSEGSPKIVNSCISNGISIGRTSKNADKALQFIELLRNDRRYYDLTQYGIEGKHWKADGDDGYISLNEELPENERYVAGCVWGWLNEEMNRVDRNALPETVAILEKWKKETIETDVRGFIFDDTNVKTEMTTISGVGSQYGSPLVHGMIEKNKIDKTVKDYRAVLEKAGIKSIMVTGKIGEIAHAWNVVEIDGEDYHVDPTSDAIEINGKKEVMHRYFNLSDTELDKTHTLDKDFNIMACNGEKYNFYTYNDFKVKYTESLRSKLIKIVNKQFGKGIIELRLDKLYSTQTLLEELYYINFNRWEDTHQTSVGYHKIDDIYVFENKNTKRVS